MSHVYPLVVWGSADDLSTYSQTGTCAITTGQADPWGGTSAVYLTDNDAATAEARYIEYTAAYTGYHSATVCTAYLSATSSGISFGTGVTAPVSHTLHTWTAGVPVASLYGGTAGSTAAVVALGSGWYLQRIWAYALTGETVRLTLSPAGFTASDTGSTRYLVQSMTLLDLPDQKMTWEEPRDGSAWAQGGSGVEDAWIQGTDYRYQATFDVPYLHRDAPASVSGWGLPLERAGCNSGVNALLRAGRNKETLTYYADRTNTATAFGVASYLVGPMNGAPAVQPNGDRRITLELRNASKHYKPYESD